MEPGTAKNPKLISRSDFHKKVILKLLASPITLTPFLLGVTDLLAMWTFDISSGVGVFAGIALILASAGVFFTRALVGGEAAGKKVLEDMEAEAQKERAKALDDLDRRLSSDGDPRTEACLRDLRTLAWAFREGGAWKGALATGSTVDILAGVEHLFDHSVQSLEKTLSLWYTARGMSTPESRALILDQRERMIRDVQASIAQLGRILAEIQGLSANRSAESDLASVRKELDRGLEVAKSVSERMRQIDRELEGDKL